MEVFDLQGTVDFFHDVKKYGFIQADDEDLEDDLFFHITDLEGDEIAEGDEVEFEPAEGERGPKAADVRVL
jgi:CspA family cold shock protein